LVLPNWHIEVLAHYLDLARQRKIKRLIITLPPRHLKSICASVAFPAWSLGHDPNLKFICASYSQDLASKHARDTRLLMQSPFYQTAFPGTRLKGSRPAEDELETTRGGYRLATSVGGTLTGRGGNVIIIDDPIKPQDAMSVVKRQAVKDWYDGTLYSRLNDKQNDVIILVMQRVHMDDLVGHVLDKGDWVVLNLPAIAEVPECFDLGDGRVYTRSPGGILHPAREPKSVLDDAKMSLGSMAFSAQYQQRPMAEGGNIVKGDWFKVYDGPLRRRSGDRIVQSWDMASKVNELSDYSACATFLERTYDGEKQYYLLDMWRSKLEFPDLLKQVRTQAGRFGAHRILIEDAGAGTGILQSLKRDRVDGIAPATPVRPDGDKIMRLTAHTAKIEAGQAWLPRQAPWLDAFLVELLAFPTGKNDDQVDAFSQFFTWIGNRYSTRQVSM
jgi:predicted phage terminase large subunit-like protein